MYNIADCSFIIWHLRLLIQIQGAYCNKVTPHISTERSASWKDTNSCIQMIMWYFINPHRENLFLSASPPQRGQRSGSTQNPTTGAGILCLAQRHISRVDGHLACLPVTVHLGVLGGGAGYRFLVSKTTTVWEECKFVCYCTLCHLNLHFE